MLGVALGLSAALGFGASAVIVRLGLEHMRATSGVLVSLAVSTVVTMAIALSLDAPDVLALSPTALLLLFIAGLLTFPIGRLLNYAGIRLAGVSRAAPIVGTAPLFATGLAVAFGGESVSGPMLLGTASIIAGLALVVSQQ